MTRLHLWTIFPVFVVPMRMRNIGNDGHPETLYQVCCLLVLSYFEFTSFASYTSRSSRFVLYNKSEILKRP